MQACFIADLHLQVSEPSTLELAAAFFEHIAPNAESLYILGDFVEYWVGDDAYAGELETALAPLRNLPALGTTTYLMHGNRDFLIGQEFAADCGLQLLSADTHLLPLGGQRPDSDQLLLMHGDTLCTDDTEYLEMRSTLRDPEWQSSFLQKTVAERTEYAEYLRQQSQAAAPKKNPLITDVNPQAVERQMQSVGVTQLLHGHTHRPAIHDMQVDGVAAKRIVVGDWHPHKALYGCLQDGQIELREWKL